MPGALGRVATGVAVFQPLVCIDQEKKNPREESRDRIVIVMIIIIIVIVIIMIIIKTIIAIKGAIRDF